MDKIQKLKKDIESTFLFAKVLIVKFKIKEDKNIEYWFYILNVPNEKLYTVKNYAISNAIDLYGDDPLPFCVSTVNPDDTCKYFNNAVIPSLHIGYEMVSGISDNILFHTLNIPFNNDIVYSYLNTIYEMPLSIPGDIFLPPVNVQFNESAIVGNISNEIPYWGSMLSVSLEDLSKNKFVSLLPQVEEIKKENGFMPREKVLLAA
ncbi:MAG: hypothetical protein M1491_05060 [Deltaproteobacteria bacterium]|nr:hypothetical protein [Deltaproteobacteria bacterium]MCL5276729.1 hypothetical protein [Deltaproteobacteria bacterium]